MRDGRWRLLLGPAFVVVAAGMVAAGQSQPPVHGAAAPPRGTAPEVAGCAAATTDRAWYQLRERADESGALIGYTIDIGASGARATSIEAPPESFAAGPFGGVVVVGTDNGRVSTVRLVVAESGCTAAVSTSSDVIRRATIDRAGRFLYTHRVSRTDRSDLGVWREPVARLDGATSVLDGLDAGVARGRRGFVRAFATRFIWSGDGNELAVQSCGAAECVTRLLDTRTGVATAYDGSDQGELLAVTPTSLISYAACRGLPCLIASTDRRTRASRVLTENAGVAVVAPGVGGGTLVFETPTTSAYRLIALDLEAATERTVYRGRPDGPTLLAQASTPLAAAVGPPGSVALVSGSTTVGAARFLRLADGTLAGWEGH